MIILTDQRLLRGNYLRTEYVQGGMMDYRDISILLVKIAGIWLIAYAVTRVPGAASFFDSSYGLPWWEQGIAILLPVAFPALIGLVFFLFPATLTNKIMRGERLSEASPAVLFDIERIALSVLGVYLLFHALSGAVFISAYFIRVEQLTKTGMLVGQSHLLGPDKYGEIVSVVVEIAVSLWLIFGAKGLVSVFRKFRGHA
jgi:hypothetical protein